MLTCIYALDFYKGKEVFFTCLVQATESFNLLVFQHNIVESMLTSLILSIHLFLI